MPLIIGTSPNISVFDYSASYNLDTAEITLTNQSTYITSAASTQGIDFVLTSPSGITYHDNSSFGVNADILSTAPTVPFVADMVTFSGAPEWGVWTSVGTIKDANGTLYSLTKTLNICKPVQCSAVKNTGDSCATISFTANCISNKILYSDTTPYSYKGIAYTTILYDVSLYYPASAGLSPVLNKNISYFSLNVVYNGTYQLVISNTATYQFDDLQSVVIVYKLNADYPISCTIGMCDILCSYSDYLEEYIDTKNNNASSQKARTMQENLILLNAYVQEAQLNLECGNDISDLVAKIEAIIGKKCNCCGTANNAQGVSTNTTVIINEGCGDITIDEVTVGSTTSWTINDITYVVDTNSDGITVTTELNGCTRTFWVDACLDSLIICNSTINVANGSGGSTHIATGGTIENIISAQNDATNVLYADIVAIKLFTSGTVTAGSATGISSMSMQYGFDGLGNVFLRGSFVINLATAAQGAIVGTIPSTSARPLTAKIFPANGSTFVISGVPFELDVLTNGQITVWRDATIIGAAGSYTVSVDSVSFNNQL